MEEKIILGLDSAKRLIKEMVFIAATREPEKRVLTTQPEPMSTSEIVILLGSLLQHVEEFEKEMKEHQ